ncbi:MAG: ECF-type sigma factor [Planctomycetota bacterium]
MPPPDPGIDPAFVERLYDELRQLAAAFLRKEKGHHTLQATALVHEAWFSLQRSDGAREGDRARFLGMAAKAMRHILVDHARRSRADKRGGDWARVTLTGTEVEAEAGFADVLDLDAKIGELAALDPRKAEVVELLYFGGLGAEEAATVLGVTAKTVRSDWRMARAWLRAALEG